MSDFWIGFIVGGFICGFIGFLGAAIFAASSKGSRMEEKIMETDEEFLHRIAKIKNNWKPEIEIVTQGKPEDA